MLPALNCALLRVVGHLSLLCILLYTWYRLGRRIVLSGCLYYTEGCESLHNHIGQRVLLGFLVASCMIASKITDTSDAVHRYKRGTADTSLEHDGVPSLLVLLYRAARAPLELFFTYDFTSVCLKAILGSYRRQTLVRDLLEHSIALGLVYWFVATGVAHSKDLIFGLGRYLTARWQ